jgi:hypothetical protein
VSGGRWVLAAALAAVAVVSAACPGGAVGPAPAPLTAERGTATPSLSADAVPRFFPSYTTPCGSEQFRDVMRDQFNASLSTVSQALFHDRDEGRMDRVADGAAVILGCAAKIDQHRPKGLVEREWVTFDHMLIQLVMNTHALQSAALEDDEEIVVHWYHHVKQSCAACHARFNEK